MLKKMCCLAAVALCWLLAPTARAQENDPCGGYQRPPFADAPNWSPDVPLSPQQIQDIAVCRAAYENALNDALNDHAAAWCACSGDPECQMAADAAFEATLKDLKEGYYLCQKNVFGPDPENPNDPWRYGDPLILDDPCDGNTPDMFMFFNELPYYAEPWAYLGCLDEVSAQCLQEAMEQWQAALRQARFDFAIGWFSCWANACNSVTPHDWRTLCLEPRITAYNNYMQMIQEQILQDLLNCGACKVEQ